MADNPCRCVICGAEEEKKSLEKLEEEWQGLLSTLKFAEVGLLKDFRLLIKSLHCTCAVRSSTGGDENEQVLVVVENMEKWTIGALVYRPGYHGLEGHELPRLSGVLINTELSQYFQEKVIQLLEEKMREIRDSYE